MKIIAFYFLNNAAVLKDVPNSPHQMIKDPTQDHIRMSAYPNLEYGNLYNALAMLLDVAPNIQFGLNGKIYSINMKYRERWFRVMHKSKHRIAKT